MMIEGSTKTQKEGVNNETHPGAPMGALTEKDQAGAGSGRNRGRAQT